MPASTPRKTKKASDWSGVASSQLSTAKTSPMMPIARPVRLVMWRPAQRQKGMKVMVAPIVAIASSDISEKSRLSTMTTKNAVVAPPADSAKNCSTLMPTIIMNGRLPITALTWSLNE